MRDLARWVALLGALMFFSDCGPGVLRMGFKFKADFMGARASIQLPLEFYPTLDGGYPPESLVCE